MPAPLHDDVIAWMQTNNLPVTTKNLNLATNMLGENPSLRPSYVPGEDPIEAFANRQLEDVGDRERQFMLAGMGFEQGTPQATGQPRPRQPTTQPQAPEAKQEAAPQVGSPTTEAPTQAASLTMQEQLDPAMVAGGFAATGVAGGAFGKLMSMLRNSGAVPASAKQEPLALPAPQRQLPPPDAPTQQSPGALRDDAREADAKQGPSRVRGAAAKLRAARAIKEITHVKDRQRRRSSL